MQSGVEIKSKPSVGEEFVEWAEAHWRLKDRFTANEEDPFGERSNYEYMRTIFVKKIDALIKDRLGL